MLTDRSRKALSFCSSLAIATVLLSAAPAGAQSFEGTGTFSSGSGSITPGTGSTTIDITSPNAVINWTTFDTATNPGVPINFQNAGTTATFNSASDFSVLNRIIPTDPSRPIQFNGTVLSRVAAAAGGTVYFYSPGGIIVGASAVFDVGNLGLTSIAPEVVGGVFEQGAGNEFVRFNGAVTAGSAVTIEPGAQITGTAGGLGSYLAVVAPQINQGGTISGKRVVALVSADAATLTFNPNGLFDIQVTSGTSATGTTLFNSGSITGPAGDLGNASRIYMVAVPKNDAITMAIGAGSALGFDIADAADVDGNAVILSGGYDIMGGQRQSTPSTGGGTGQVDLFVQPDSVTSAITAASTGRAILFANAGQIANYASDVSVAGTQSTSDPNEISVQVFAHDAGSQLNIAGNVSVTALDPKVVAPASGYQVTNFAVLDAINGGAITVGGNATVTNDQSSSTPGVNLVTGAARIAVNAGSTIDIAGNATVTANTFITSSGSATGGNATLDSRGNGAIDVGGVTRVLAYGIAGTNNGAGGSGGTGIGGTAAISAASGGTFSTNELNVAADGVGGADAGSGAGSGTGGFAGIFATDAGSTITIASGNVSGNAGLGDLDLLSAEGFGGHAPSSGVGGAGIGGTADVGVINGAVLNGPANGGTFGLVRIIARGTGGNAGTGATAGGSATGGTINITVDNATMTSAELLPSAFAQGGSALPTATGAINGGNAVGGNRNITVRNGGVLTTSLGGGSAGGVGGTATATGRGGDASGGLAGLNVDNGTFNVTDRALFFTQNTGGDGGTGGNATGGQVFADILNGGVVNVSAQGPTQRFLVAADNRGGNSLSVPGAAGGNATGGSAQLIVNNGTLASPDIVVSAMGIGGGGLVAQGGNGTGGTARFQMRGGSISGTTLRVDASGSGGSIDPNFSGNGGNGAGGFATLEATSGTTTLAFTGTEVRGDGLGGDALGAAGNGGAGLGGSAQVFAGNGATLTATAVEGFVVNVDSSGGFAAGAGDGGNATAGSARVIVDNGNMTLNGDLEVDGGTSGGDGVNGGAGFGNPDPNAPNASISVNGGSLAVSGFTQLDGDISGGAGRDGGDGGNAGSGYALVFAGNSNGASPRGSISLQDVLIESSSNGGSAFGTGDGGDAAGGRAHIFVNGGDIAVAGFAELESVATGGDGTNGGDAISPQPFRQPRALIGSFNGTVDVGGFAFFDASAFGGNATEPGGGSGGVAFAGQAGMDAQSQNGPSAVTVGDLLINVSASGGFGGEGLSGQAGGAGGDAYGGFAFGYGNAGRGELTVTGDTLIDATAFGGFGGQGGSGGTSAPGGNGGTGGRAIGGGVNLGTISGVETAENAGSASFGLVTAIAQAFGGLGGDGGSGTTQGNGGSGGTGFGGFGGILVRGSPATFGDVVFDVSGTGGDGGVGAAVGNGGDGYAGDLSVTVTQRFNRTERGSLTAGNVSLFAGGFGGTGAVDGRSFYSAASGSERGFFIRQSDVVLASLALATTGDLAPNATATILRVQDQVTGSPVPTQVTVIAEPLDITVAQSSVDIAGHFVVATPGQMAVSLDASTVDVGSLSLDAGNFVLPATRPATLGTFNVAGTPSITTGLDFLAYANFAFPGGWLIDVDGSVLTGSITNTGALSVTAGGAITTDALDAGDVFLNSGQGTATLSIDSDGRISIVGGGAVSTGNLSAGAGVPGAGKVAIASAAGPVSTGAVTSSGDLGIQTGGSIATGNLAGRDVLLLAGGSLSTGAIAAPSGAVYFGSNSMATSTANVFQPFRGTAGMLPIFNAQPTALGGSVVLGGAVQAGSLWGAGDGTLSGGAISATGFIDLTVGGLATVNGAWGSPRIDLISGDITITPTGSLDALSSAGEILLATSNAAGVFVGDGLGSSANGYALDNAEFSRLRAGEIAIVGIDTAQATDMTVGNLAVTGSQLYGADGTLILATGDLATEIPAGTLRIAGAVSGSGFTPTSAIGLLSGTVEIEAVSGSVKLANDTGGLGGLVYIEADHVHAASDEILTRLRADPLYAGHIADINRPLTVARPDGVLNALGIEVFPGRTFYVQNTGTVATPAGFLTTFDNSEVTAPDQPPPGGIEVVINGQFQTATGPVSGKAAFALVQADPTPDSEQFAGFSSTSQLNGCLFLGGTCASASTSDPVAAVSSEITVFVAQVLADSPSAPAAASADEGEEGSADEPEGEDEGDTGASPIAPPAPLVNTRPLNPNANVNEPVSGAGNPALLGSAVNEENAEGGNQ